jgi:hypothetical protein
MNTTDPDTTAPLCGQSTPNADSLRTCSGCQNDLVCHDQGECLWPVPVCVCDDVWPGQGHHPECPVLREITEARERIAAMREAIREAHEALFYILGDSVTFLHNTAIEKSEIALAKLQPFLLAE